MSTITLTKKYTFHLISFDVTLLWQWGWDIKIDLYIFKIFSPREFRVLCCVFFERHFILGKVLFCPSNINNSSLFMLLSVSINYFLKSYTQCKAFFSTVKLKPVFIFKYSLIVLAEYKTWVAQFNCGEWDFAKKIIIYFWRPKEVNCPRFFRLVISLAL